MARRNVKAARRSATLDVMAEPKPELVTQVLAAVAAGEAGAADQLLPLVYEELKALARRRMADERAGHTLQATALVHEAYLRLVAPSPDAAPGTGPGVGPGWSGRGHFYGAAAEAMRRILVEHARARGRSKRGGGAARVSLQSLASVELASACD